MTNWFVLVKVIVTELPTLTVAVVNGVYTAITLEAVTPDTPDTVEPAILIVADAVPLLDTILNSFML